MKGKARRLLSWVCVLALCMSLLPVTALAVTDGETNGTETTKVYAEANGVTVNKWVSTDKDGNYRLNMEAYASNEVTSTTTTKPLDIVLVLDVSGSMNEGFGEDGYQYKEVTNKTDWSYSDIEGWQAPTYYYKDENNNYHKVEGEYDRWSDEYSIGYNTWSWGDDWHQLGEITRSEDATCWTGTLYTWERTTRLSAMKTAVNTFIDSVNGNATETGVDHQIGIVSFSDKKMATKVEDLTSVKTESNALKNSVNGLSANGSTYVDRGMSVAKSMLDDVNRDSQKVVVVFTDGVPGYSTNWGDDSGSTAAAAITTAKEMKDAGVTVYAVGILRVQTRVKILIGKALKIPMHTCMRCLPIIRVQLHGVGGNA